MSNLVYFSSVSENTHRFVEKLGLPATRIPLHGRIEVDEPTCWCCPPTAAGAPHRTSTTVAMSPNRSSLSEQRTQPVADPRRHRRGQQQLR